MSTLGPEIRLLLVLVAWGAWFLALVGLRKSRREPAVRIDSRARWGLVLQMAGYAVVCSQSPRVWASELEVWRAIAGTLLAIIAILLFWNAVVSLGRQWRFDAGLNKDHELVQRGVYSIVRHPIYASMFAMLLADVLLIGTLPGWPIGVVLFIVGTEIRVRVEDGLLYERFGERFLEWQKSRPAYLPFVR